MIINSYRQILLVAIVACASSLLPVPARAECTLAGTAVCDGVACAGEIRPTGHILYNQDFDVSQVCRSDGTWQAISPINCPAGDGCGSGGADPCAGSSPSPGDVCTDGSVYAGLSPDGNVPMYTTPADESSGAYWGTYGFTTGSTSNVTGRANSADVYAHVQAGNGTHNPDDGYTPNASVLCEELSAHGHSDWYLPARDELNVLYTNRAAIGGFNTSGSFPAGSYWSSSEASSTYARIQRFSDGGQASSNKITGLSVRCVRR